MSGPVTPPGTGRVQAEKEPCEEDNGAACEEPPPPSWRKTPPGQACVRMEDGGGRTVSQAGRSKEQNVEGLC